jgi:membrane associated rhomboid family serine protease
MRLPQPQQGGSSYAPGPPWYRTTYWFMTTWLIALNVVIFILDVLFQYQLTRFGALSGHGIVHLQFWQLLTFQFLHAGPFHLLFNMLWLYFLGPLVEWRFGKMRFLFFYLFCGLAGGALFLFQWYFRDRPAGHDSLLVGASAGIFGVMAAAVRLAPGIKIRFWFPPIAVTLRAMFWIMVGLAAITIYTGGFNNGGEAAHLGGAAMGALLVRKVNWLNFSQGPRRQRFWKPGDPTTSFIRKNI